jgi:aspartokinase/homoserine dehydrogenase 1
MSSHVLPPPVAPAELAAPSTVVHKFGGTSVADAERYRHVGSLLRARPESQQVTVVSAMKGVTDALIELAQLAAQGDEGWREAWHALRARHRGAAVALLGEQVGDTVEWIDARFEQLSEVLAALTVIGELPREVLDRVQGLGEVFSAQLLGTYLRACGEDCAVLDARDVLVVGLDGVRTDLLRRSGDLLRCRGLRVNAL